MEWTDPLDHRIVQEFEALLLKQRVRLRESVRARMTERRTGEPRRSPEDATNAVESLGEELEVAMLDRESREAAQIDAALERLARDEYGICRNCGTVIGLARPRALPFAQHCTACQAGVEVRERGVEAEWRPRSIRPEPRPSSPTVRVAPPERERPYLPIREICGEPVARVPDLTHGRRRYHPGACEQAARRARNPRKPGPVRLAWVEPGL